MKETFSVAVSVSAEAADAAEHVLDLLGAIGTSMDLMPRDNADVISVTGYFDSPLPVSKVEDELLSTFRHFELSPADILKIEATAVPDQDWLAEWKKHWKPTQIGGFVVAAPWHELADDGALVIRIEPSMAFGTGTHETTQLCLSAIDRHYRPEMSFLDVGTGTGLLAIAAALTAQQDVKLEAVEIDGEATAIARENARLNGVGDRIRFHTGSLDAADGNFDLICANLTADVIVPLLPDLLARSRTLLVLSGILPEQERQVVEALPPDAAFSVSRAGEWIALIIQR